ncbi:hypothetical protein FRX31_027238 [Thalictrum thalictroides]|uniref:Uncharacterized protein n=1 Tax=Thalictrum thalictroides TaxID=46969 RepID=A0A7J6VDJ1_THATH|nr:hypothetical protein FRX31_027238 [Thalictrum thalictroides]
MEEEACRRMKREKSKNVIEPIINTRNMIRWERRIWVSGRCRHPKPGPKVTREVLLVSHKKNGSDKIRGCSILKGSDRIGVLQSSKRHELETLVFFVERASKGFHRRWSNGISSGGSPIL